MTTIQTMKSNAKAPPVKAGTTKPVKAQPTKPVTTTKPAAPAPTKPAPAPAKAAPAKASAPADANKKIALLVKENPHDASTKAHAKWKLVAESATVGAALKVVDRGYLNYAVSHKWIAIG
jgi:hypothetical protein